MKQSKDLWRMVFISFGLFILVSGCITAGPPKLDQAFFPNSQPDKPEIKIALTPEIIEQLNKLYLSMFWLSEDNILLEIGPKGINGVYDTVPLFGTLQERRNSNTYRYMIFPNRSEVKRLEGAEEEVIMKDINDKVNVHQTDKTSASVLSKLFSIGGGTSTENYSGTIKDGSNTVDVEIGIKEKSGSGSGGGFFGGFAAASCSTASLNAVITNNQNGNSMPLSIGWRCALDAGVDHQTRLISFFRKLSIAPDGSYYAVGDAFWNARLGKKAELIIPIENYSNIDTSINPQWTKMAMLRYKKEEGKKDIDFWIEIFPFTVPDNAVKK